MDVKDTNPKDTIGVRKVPFSTIPAAVMAEVGLAMLEGAAKYGRHNYRVAGVRASVYYDAALRHLTAWWESEDVDPDSGLSHVTKAIAGLVVLRDAMMNGMMTDDRPPAIDKAWLASFNETAANILDRYPELAAPFVRGDGPANDRVEVRTVPLGDLDGKTVRVPDGWPIPPTKERREAEEKSVNPPPPWDGTIVSSSFAEMDRRVRQARQDATARGEDMPPWGGPLVQGVTLDCNPPGNPDE